MCNVRGYGPLNTDKIDVTNLAIIHLKSTLIAMILLKLHILNHKISHNLANRISIIFFTYRNYAIDSRP